jgi:reactive intermediate/imine deaminase
MEKTQVNPWTWQDRAGFSQAWTVRDAEQVVYVSGQVSVSADGEVVGDGDFEAQVHQVFQNLQTVLTQAGATLDAIVKITIYLTDITRLRDFGQLKGRYIEGPQPASTAVEVKALALPGLMLEVEAIAVI